MTSSWGYESGMAAVRQKVEQKIAKEAKRGQGRREVRWWRGAMVRLRDHWQRGAAFRVLSTEHGARNTLTVLKSVVIVRQCWHLPTPATRRDKNCGRAARK